MDYESYTLVNYNIPVEDVGTNNFLYLYSDGSYELVEDTNYSDSNYNSLELLLGYCANYSNRVLVGSTRKSLISCGRILSNTGNYGDIVFMNTNKLDFMVYGSSNGGNSMYASIFSENDSIDDLSSINNYYQDSSRENISDFAGEDNNYGNFYVADFTYCVFDYTNLKYDNINDGILYIRGENTAFHIVLNEFYYSRSSQSIHLSYGAPYYSQYQAGEQHGYNDGFTAGWVQGNDNGYAIGINANGNISQQTATAFDYIGGAFTAVGNIMNLEVLPNITLGIAFTIPMVFVLIMTIFKLVRK